MERYSRSSVGRNSASYRRTNSPPIGPFHNKPSKNNDHRFRRSENYRKKFLSRRKGLFGSRVYVCAYCGKLITERGMQVDHCIPVDAAKQSGFTRLYIRVLGLFQKPQDRADGINGLWNLVPSCPVCNGNKSNQTGFWVIRGMIGRFLFPLLWYIGSIAFLWSLGNWILFGQGFLAELINFLGSFGGIMAG